MRATSNGTSALVAPGGRLLATCDHTVEGYRLLVGDVPLGAGAPTLHSRLGDWPLFLGCLLLALVRRRAAAGGRAPPAAR